MLNLKSLILIALLALTSGCGYFSDEPVKNSDLYNSQDSLNSRCTLSPDQLTRIFEQDIQEQITCLREQFVSFSRYVRTNNSDSISKDELQLFVRKFFAQSSDSIIKGLHVIFELNMILLRDHASQISRDNIDPLYRLLLSVNKQGLEIANSLRLMTGEDGHQHFFTEREKLRSNLVIFAEQMRQVISQRDGIPQRLNIKEFILNLNTRFNFEKNIFDEELVDSLIFLKRLFIGGDREVITSDEVYALLDLTPQIVMEAFDLVFSNSKVFPEENKLFRFYQQKIVNIKGLLHPIEEDEVLFDEDDLYRIYEALTNNQNREDLDLTDYRVILKSVKKDLIGGHETDYTFNELKRALLLVNMGIEGLIFVNETNEVVKDINLADPVNVNNKRIAFLSETQKFIDQIFLRINEIPHLPSQIKILDFFKTLNDNIDTLDYDTDVIEAVFAIKTLSVGGNKEVLTKDELFKVLKNLLVYSELYFDLRYTIGSLDPQTDERTEFFLAKINQVESLFVNLDNDLIVLTQPDVYALIKILEANVDIQKELQKIYLSFKSNILRGTNTNLNFSELKKTTQYAKLLTFGSSFIKFHQKVMTDIGTVNDSEYELLKTRYIAEFSILTGRIRQAIKEHNLIEQDIFYFNFLSDLALSLNIEQFDIEFLTDLLPIKTLMVGGDFERFTQDELLDLLDKLPEFTAPMLDMARSGIQSFDKIEMIQLVSTLKKNVHVFEQDTYIASIEQLASLAVRFVADLPLDKFVSTIKIAKQKILGGSDQEMTSKDFTTLFEMLYEFTELTYFTEVTYKAMQDELESTRTPIRKVPALDLPEYSNLRATHLKKYRAHFKDVVVKHRYFTDQGTKLQFWGHEIFRTEYGILELSGLKWIIEYLIRGWGTPTPGAYKGYVLDIAQMEQALLDFKPVLVEFGLWTEFFNTFARNALLLADLFQNSSNGDVRVGLDELSEFATLILSAINMSNMFLEKLTQYCTPMNGSSVDDWSFETDCYRRHFFKVIMDELGLKKNLPMLNRFYRDAVADGSNAPIDYLINVEGFARSFPDDVEMVRREFTLVIGALINIETTFIRFDLNKNNRLDSNEVDRAFLVYENAIMSVSELSESRRKYAKSIFIYMLKYMKLPSPWELISFHYNPFNDKQINAYRLNVGVLLYYLVNTETQEE